MPSTLPTLETDRTVLRPARQSDAQYLTSLWADPLFRQYLFDDAEINQAAVSTILGEYWARAETGCGLWQLNERGSKEALGCIGLSPTTVAAEYDPDLKDLLEPLVALHPAHWPSRFPKCTRGREALAPGALHIVSSRSGGEITRGMNFGRARLKAWV